MAIQNATTNLLHIAVPKEIITASREPWDIPLLLINQHNYQVHSADQVKTRMLKFIIVTRFYYLRLPLDRMFRTLPRS